VAGGSPDRRRRARDRPRGLFPSTPYWMPIPPRILRRNSCPLPPKCCYTGDPVQGARDGQQREVGPRLDAPDLPISRLGVLCRGSGGQPPPAAGNLSRLRNAATPCLDIRECDSDPAVRDAVAQPSRRRSGARRRCGRRARTGQSVALAKCSNRRALTPTERQ
jgi:hypothetical protein